METQIGIKMTSKKFFFSFFFFFLLCKYACLHTNLSCYTSSVISTIHRADCCTPRLGLTWTKMCGFWVFKTSSGHMALHLVCDCFSAANTNDKSEAWKWHEICHTGRWGRGGGGSSNCGSSLNGFILGDGEGIVLKSSLICPALIHHPVAPKTFWFSFWNFGLIISTAAEERDTTETWSQPIKTRDVAWASVGDSDPACSHHTGAHSSHLES